MLKYKTNNNNWMIQPAGEAAHLDHVNVHHVSLLLFANKHW